MRIIERHITQTLIVVFLATLVIFSILFVLIDSASNLDEFLKQNVSLWVLIQYYLYYTPVIVVQTASMAALIAALLTYTHLHMNNELIALRASGLNFWQVTRPALIFGLVVVFVIMALQERFLPAAQERYQKIRSESMVLESKDLQKKQPVIHNLSFYGLKNRLYFIDTFDPNTTELTGITIIASNDRQEIKEKIFALKGIWSGLAWKFFQCQITTYAEGVSGASPVKFYPEKLMDIQETPRDFASQRLNVSSMNMRQLSAYIQRFSKSGAYRAVTSLKVDLYRKLSGPVASVVVILVGLPLVMRSNRRKAQNFTALAISVGIGFLYYVSDAVSVALGKGGALYPPLLAAWLTPLLFLGVAWYLTRENS